MKPFFVTHEDDISGVEAIKIVETLGSHVRTLVGEEAATETEIALFTPTGKLDNGGRYLKTSAIRLVDEFTPPWARSTPFRGALRTPTDH